MAISMGLVISVLALHMTGFMPGNTGYASAAQLDILRIDRIEEKIIDARRRQCSAMSDRNDKAKAFYFKSLSKERRAFEDITGKKYDLPGCDEI